MSYALPSLNGIGKSHSIVSNRIRKHVSCGYIRRSHKDALGTMLPHSCSGIGGSTGAGVLLVDALLQGQPSLIGLRTRLFFYHLTLCEELGRWRKVPEPDNTMLTVSHPAFVSQYFAFVFPTLSVEQRQAIQSYALNHKDTILRYCKGFDNISFDQES